MSPGKGVANKGVVITAGASGIGLTIAKCFLGSGARVYVLDIDERALANAYEMNPSLEGGVVDMGNRESVIAGISAAQHFLGSVNVLVNNAGIGGPSAALENIPQRDWQRSIDVNLSGAFYAMQSVIPAMKQARDGVILNISTTAQRTALPNRTPYVVSKVALAGLSHNAARELGPFNIRVNTILPGLIDNARGRMLLQRAADAEGCSVEDLTTKAKRFISMRSIISEEEIGDMAVFLASDAARHVTAQEISVDGNLEWDV